MNFIPNDHEVIEHKKCVQISYIDIKKISYKSTVWRKQEVLCPLYSNSELGKERDFGGEMDYLPAPEIIWSYYSSFKHTGLDLIIPDFSFPFTFWHWRKVGGRIYYC